MSARSASGNPHYTSRAIVVATDTEGKARAWFTTGKLSGPGANAVRGQNQISETGAQAMEILSAVVRDAGNNPLPNVKVQFKREEGNAFFADSPAAPAAADGKSIIVATDKNGVVGIRPTIGHTA